MQCLWRFAWTQAPKCSSFFLCSCLRAWRGAGFADLHYSEVRYSVWRVTQVNQIQGFLIICGVVRSNNKVNHVCVGPKITDSFASRDTGRVLSGHHARLTSGRKLPTWLIQISYDWTHAFTHVPLLFAVCWYWARNSFLMSFLCPTRWDDVWLNP
jgi:hypothetical protein